MVTTGLTFTVITGAIGGQVITAITIMAILTTVGVGMGLWATEGTGAFMLAAAAFRTAAFRGAAAAHVEDSHMAAVTVAAEGIDEVRSSKGEVRRPKEG